MDLKLKNYSSGMHVRLAFSVAIQVDADILLIDEVLAVGDAAFQQKCFDEFTRLRDEGRTIVFVTHDMGSVERFCDRAMLLERGRVVDIGDPVVDRAPVQRAQLRVGPRGSAPADASPSEVAAGRRSREILNAWFESPRRRDVVTASPRASRAACGWTSGSTPRSRIRSSRSACRRGRARRVRREHQTLRRSSTGHFDAGTTAQRPGCGSRTGSRPAATACPRRSRAPASAPTCSTPTSAARSSCSRTGPAAAMADLPHTLRDRAHASATFG